KDFIVQTFSNKFYKEFNLNPTSMKNQNIQSIFNMDFSKLILKESGANIKIGKNEYHFEYKYLSSNSEDGYYFSFNKIYEKNTNSGSSEKAFDMVMYTSPDPMFIYGIDNLRFLKVNEAALSFYGYREDEFLAMDLTDLYAPEDIQTLVESSSRNTMERGYTGPWRQKKKDGSTIEVEISKSGVEYNNSRAHLNIVRDISQNSDSDKIADQFNLIFENTSDIVLLTDADGFIKEANKSAYEKLGFENKFLIERSFLSLVTDEYRAKVNTSIMHSARPQKVNFNCELKNSEGNSIKAEIVATPIFGANKEVTSFSIMAKMEKEIVRVVEKEYVDVAPAVKQQGGLDTEFLGHFFHELLTPVNVIIGFSQELAENADDSDEEAKEAADIIKQNQRVLSQLMDNAVQYTELEQNKVEFNPTNVHFVELIDQIEADIKKVSSNLGKEFSYGKISSSLVFETDEGKLQTLTTLLVEFAMRATKREKIFLSAYQSDAGHCVVSVKDDRNAISKELVKDLNEIFTGDENVIRHKYGISRFMLRFALKLSNLLAESSGTINKYGGPFEFGFTFPIRFDEKKANRILNNAIPLVSKTAVEKSQNEYETEKIVAEVQPQPSDVKEEKREPISVHQNVNNQSNARQNIQQTPNVAEVVPENVIVEKEEVAVAEEIASGADEVRFEDLSCLYVEDQIDSQILFKVQMKQLKSIEFANSFEKAIPLLKANKYDFIIMDINLQGEYYGLDALRAIQKMPEYIDVPIVAVTAYVLPGDRERFITAGFNEFISKPILCDKLETVLNNIF
ncbi:MAG: PAS domain S-box protein, partial [Melioribacteraceae bacterium]|nr:PAS domain S-box protein [Melioribacteraceae bacterium]